MTQRDDFFIITNLNKAIDLTREITKCIWKNKSKREQCKYSVLNWRRLINWKAIWHDWQRVPRCRWRAVGTWTLPPLPTDRPRGTTCRARRNKSTGGVIPRHRAGLQAQGRSDCDTSAMSPHTTIVAGDNYLLITTLITSDTFISLLFQNSVTCKWLEKRRIAKQVENKTKRKRIVEHLNSAEESMIELYTLRKQ